MRTTKGQRRISTIVLMIFVIICIAPLSLTVLNSFKESPEITRNPLSISFSAGLENYRRAWKYGRFSGGFLNSIKLCFSAIITALTGAVLSAYVIANKKIKGTWIITIYFLVAMTIPFQLFLVPLYSTFAKYGLLGNHFAVGMIIGACNLPFSVTLMRTFFLGVPRELEEQARIDGAGTWQVIRRIILPIISPGIITVAIIVGLNSWNEYLLTATFLMGEKNFTATMGMLSLISVNLTDPGTNLAGAVILIGPVLAFFLTMQKYFIEGIVSGSVKG